MKITWKIIIICLAIHCSNDKEEKENAKRNFFLCVIIGTEMATDSKTAVGITTACGFKYSKAFREEESSIPFQ